MTGLHLVQAHVDMAAFNRWAGDRGWTSPAKRGAGSFDEGLALHHLTAEMFGERALRPFRLLVPPRARTGNLYAYATRPGDELRKLAEVQAMPDQIAVLPPDRLLTKPMPEDFSAGQRIGFDLRLRPVRRLKTSLGERFGAGSEVDAFVVEALRKYAGDETGMAAAGRTREAVYLDWLAERLDPAAGLDRSATRLHAFRRSRVVRNGMAQEGPEAVVHGTLTVTDPLQFADVLRRGVGRHCAYGYGMMLLRAPQAPVPVR